ncbi:MAG: hypothetical protein JSS46_12205 [Proteobacteria bacterium]|jgi:nitrate reductase delta subunit|nr:hypothetical protein [Pseudomonadota bacterium]
MSHAHDHRRIAALFADILDYPARELTGKAAECEALLAGPVPAAADLLREFRAFTEGAPLGKLEEAYSGFFDLNPICHPYIGYQLFGENYKRSSFLLGLKERYRAETFQSSPSEIADRLSVVLRFVAHSEGGEDTDDLVREGLLPALERMTTRPESGDDHHDGPGDFDGDTGVERKQLDGHSHGEVLAGGFVLETSDDAEERGARGGDAAPHPYYRALQALHIALQETWPH